MKFNNEKFRKHLHMMMDGDKTIKDSNFKRYLKKFGDHNKKNHKEKKIIHLIEIKKKYKIQNKTSRKKYYNNLEY